MFASEIATWSIIVVGATVLHAHGVIAGVTRIGFGLNFVGMDPIKVLIFTAVFNGIAAVRLVFLIARVARDRDVMGQYQSGVLSSILVWLSFGGMGAAALGLFFTLACGG